MVAKPDGVATWIIEENLGSSSEYEKKYKPVLTELSKFVGAACNTGDIEAFQFLMHYTTMIFEAGYEVLKQTFDEAEKSKDFDDFIKKMGVGNS